MAVGINANLCGSIPVIGSTDGVFVYTELTTTTTTANQVVATYTVPANKSFYLISYCWTKITNPGAYPNPFSLQANGVNIRRTSVENTTAAGYGNWFIWAETFPFPIYVAAAAQVVRVTVTPSSTTSTIWGGSIMGVLR